MFFDRTWFVDLSRLVAAYELNPTEAGALAIVNEVISREQVRRGAEEPGPGASDIPMAHTEIVQLPQS